MAEPVEEADVGGPDLAASGSDGLAAALIAVLGRRGDGGKADPEFEAFLRQQTRLSELQTEHLHEQRAVILSNLKLRRVNEWMKAALQALTMLVGLAIVIALAVMAWQAHEDHGVTVEAFSVPPDLAQRGLTGQVVASRLLARLADLQAKTATSRPASSYANDWGSDIKVEIPETGVSIGELNRYLRDWLGSATRITGDVVRTPTGIAVTAQAGASAAATFEGSDADLSHLIQQSAEAIYAQTQPYRYAVYLASDGKTDEALKAYIRLAEDSAATPKDRAWAYTGWATLLFERNDARGALAKSLEAIRLDPWIEPAYVVRVSAYNPLGQPGDELAALHAALHMLESGRAEGITPEAARAMGDSFRTGGYLLGNFSATLAALRHMPERLNLEGGSGYAWRNSTAQALASMHDVSSARRQFPAGSPPLWYVQEEIAEALDDWPTALSLIDQQPASSRSDPSAQADRADFLARLGQLAKAGAAIAPTPLDCTTCLVARGEIAARAGDRKGADRWFQEAVRQAPLPDEYLSWGRSLLLLGDPDAAIAKLKQAHKLGPHYADPLEVWGEALMAERNYTAAIPKFAAADKDAPKWGRNHLRWGEALMLAGRYAEARAQYETANGLDLSVGDRAALKVLLARTATGPLHG